MNINPLFEPFRLKGMNIRNRLAVAPMTRVSGTPDGQVGPLMKCYYESFAKGGFGLIITEGLYTDQHYSQGYENQPGLTCERQARSWVEVVQGVQSAGCRIFAQLMHAGALSQFNRFVQKPKGPSAIRPPGQKLAFYGQGGVFSLPEALSREDIDQAIRGFADSARLAKQCGFDGVEIHGANGYLLDQFLTTYSNDRMDEYGGSLENRVRFYEEVVTAVRESVGPDFVVGMRISQAKVNNPSYVWPEKNATAKHLCTQLGLAGVDYIHTTEPCLNQPFAEDDAPLSQVAKYYGKVPVIANGGVTDPGRAVVSIGRYESDMVAIGKAALSNQDWPRRVKRGSAITQFDVGLLTPKANLENAKQFQFDVDSSR